MAGYIVRGKNVCSEVLKRVAMEGLCGVTFRGGGVGGCNCQIKKVKIKMKMNFFITVAKSTQKTLRGSQKNHVTVQNNEVLPKG